MQRYDYQSADEKLKDVGITEKLGDFVPLDVTLTNEKGEEIQIAEIFDKGQPVLLNVIYFNCPSICSLILNGVTDAMSEIRWKPGREYQVITLSMDHSEGHELAAAKKNSYLHMLGRDEAADGWHFLTGSEEEIRRLTDAVGFNFKWSDEHREFLHGSAIMFLSPEGKVARYLYGAEYSTRDVTNALFDASNGTVGSTMERIALYCFTFDPDSGQYVPFAMNIMKVGGAVVLLSLGLVLGIFWIRERSKDKNEISL